MANKKSIKKQPISSEKSTARRTRVFQIIFAVFSIMLILSMVLASLSTF